MNIVLNERSFITYGPYISPFLFNKKDLFIFLASQSYGEKEIFYLLAHSIDGF